METVLIVVHLIITLCLVALILLQRSEGGGLGVGGSGNMGAMAPRAKGDVLTKSTGFLGACFIVTSLLLVIMASSGNKAPSLVDKLSAQNPAPAAPAAPNAPSNPLLDALQNQPAAPAVPSVPASK